MKHKLAQLSSCVLLLALARCGGTVEDSSSETHGNPSTGGTAGDAPGGTGASPATGGTGDASGGTASSGTGGTGGDASGGTGASPTTGGTSGGNTCDSGHGGYAGAFFNPNQALCNGNVPMIVDYLGFPVNGTPCEGDEAMCEVVPCNEAKDSWYCCGGNTSQCTGCPAGMVSAGTFCIDAREVSRGDYGSWLASNPPVAPYCTIEADVTCLSDGSVCQGSCDAHPQVCVTQCGAGAYCQSRGAFDVCSLSQLEAPCGANTYPYGDAYDATACNGADHGVGTTVPGGTLAQCVSATGYGTVFDLSGNVAEWVACDMSGGLCEVYGGGFDSAPDALTCGASEMVDPSLRLPGIGFRCCSLGLP